MVVAALALPTQHHLAGTHPQIPMGSRVSQLTMGTPPWGQGGIAHGDPAVGTTQAPAQKSPLPLPILGSCPQGASGS